MAGGVEYQVTKVDPTDPTTKGKVFQVHQVDEVTAYTSGKVYRARIIKDPSAPEVRGMVYQIVLIDDPDDPTVKGKVYNAILTGGSTVVIVGPEIAPLDLPDAIANSLEYLKAFGDCENRNLPEGYQELEYIEGLDNTQYINTGIVPTANMKIYAKFSLVSGSLNNWSPFGCRKTTGGDDGLLFFGGALSNTSTDVNWLDTTVSTNRWRINNVSALGDVYEYKMKSSLAEVIKNGTSLGTHQFTPDATCDQPIYINGMNNAGSPLSQTSMTLRQYRFTIEGICDMRPARRLSDGVLGMYDTIRKQFYTNAGTGSFIAGAALTLPEGYTRIEYIEGNNNLQYINTGIVPTSSMSMYFKGQFVSVDESTPTQVSFLAGARDVGGQYGFFLQLASTNVGLDWFVVNGRWTENNTRANGDIVEMRVNNSLAQMWLNGTSVGTHQYTPDDTTQYPLFLNGLNSVGQPFSNFNSINRIYRFTIDGVADFVPARRDSDGAIGMFNVLNNQFYGNAGTGTFTAGGVVAPTPTTPQDIWCNNGAIKAIRPIKYLESTGTQYIDTGVVPKIGMKVEYEYSSPDIPSSNKFLFGSRSSGAVLTSTDQFYVAILNTAQEQLISGVDKTIIRDYQPNVDYTTTATNSSATANGTYNIILFGFNVIGTINCAGSKRIKSFKIYDNNTLIRDFIAALDANNTPCMFDKVEGKCYYNAGTGQFVAGYLPADYEELEYIQGYTGNSSVDPSIKAAYIDTGIIFDTTLNMYYKGGIGVFNNNSVLAFGARPNNAYSGISSYFSGTDVVTDWGGTDASGRWTLPLDLIAGDTFEVSTYNKIMTISKNGVVAGTNTFTGTATNNLSFYLNSRHDTGGVPSQSSPSIGRLYRFTVAGVCDMIPARKRSNGHIGMYDLIRRQFFESAGEGQFTIGKLPILPDGYTQLEYLESTGTQYIDTGVVPNQDTSVELDGSLDGYGIIFGVRTAPLVDISTIQGTSTGYWAMGYNTAADAIGTKDSNRHVWFKNKNLQYMDGELKNNYTYANFTAMGNAYLFAYNNNGTVGYVINGRVRVYSCKIWATADSMLVRHLIPAKRNSDGVVGMYDIMNDVFLTNQGTGDFEYGSEIPDSRESYYYVDGLVEKVGTHSTSNKNLFNGIFEQGVVFNGNYSNTNIRIRITKPITLPAGTYTVSCASAYELIFQINGVSENVWYQDKTLTLSSTDKLMICARNKANPSGDILPTEPVNVQIEAGSTATAYVPYCDGGLAVCENLLGIGSTQDVQEILTGEVTRKVGVFVLTGEEWWEKLNFAGKSVFRAKAVIPDDRYSNPENNIGLCSHFTVIPTSAGVTSAMNNLELAWNTNSLMCIRYDSMSTLNDFLAFLRSQYDAGTPVTIVYPLTTASTESVAGQTLTVSAGNNTAEIIQASIDDLMLEAKYEKEG